MQNPKQTLRNYLYNKGQGVRDYGYENNIDDDDDDLKVKKNKLFI